MYRFKKSASKCNPTEHKATARKTGEKKIFKIERKNETEERTKPMEKKERPMERKTQRLKRVNQKRTIKS